MIPPRFAADVMLGKLAKWLRLSGFDTFYSNLAEDDFLRELCLRENRILLTRDTLLHRRIEAGASYLVVHDHLKEQLAEVSAYFSLQRFRSPFRCSLCNGELETIEKLLIETLVPPYVYQNHSQFSRCQLCGKIYWPGTHLVKIRKALLQVQSSPLPDA